MILLFSIIAIFLVYNRNSFATFMQQLCNIKIK